MPTEYPPTEPHDSGIDTIDRHHVCWECCGDPEGGCYAPGFQVERVC